MMNMKCTSGGKEKLFKKCSYCGFEWIGRASFLVDSNIEIIGYQVHFKKPTAGSFLFNHSCGTTLAVSVGEFVDLYEGPVFTTRPGESEDCPTYCLYRRELRPCAVECECAFVREIIQLIKGWPKSPDIHQREASARLS
jgi:hypothetical protein